MGCITNDALLLMLRKLCHLVRLLPIIFLYWRQADGDIETPHIIGDTKKEANLPDSCNKPREGQERRCDLVKITLACGQETLIIALNNL